MKVEYGSEIPYWVCSPSITLSIGAAATLLSSSPLFLCAFSGIGLVAVKKDGKG